MGGGPIKRAAPGGIDDLLCLNGFAMNGAGGEEIWWLDTPCSGKGELFFSQHPRDIEQARLICHSSCLSREQCLQYALDHHEQTGVWGGESGRSRRRIARLRRKPPA
jgi:hypothetical protein